MMDTEFREWLLKKKKLAHKQSGDVVSRCKRIERVLDVSLDSAVTSDGKMEKLQQRLTAESDQYLRPGANPIFAVSQLRVAARLYAEFKRSQG